MLTERYGATGRSNIYTLGGATPRQVDKSDKIRRQSLQYLFADLFLPQGYPHSVSEDYLEYQLFDTLQAFASSIVGTLATQAVLKGVGVGDESATVLAATMTWLLKDGTGMLGRIMFAYARGSQLDYDSKKWRLFADVLNDISFFIDLLAPYAGGFVTLVLCTSSFCRSIVGVAGGATRAALTQHQALRNNLADVSAKDGSQETLVNLSALLCSFLLMPLVAGKTSIIWFMFIALITFHIFANYRAVRSLRMDTFNRKRYRLVIRHFLNTGGDILSVRAANYQEPLFSDFICLHRKPVVNFGCSLGTAFSAHSVVTFSDMSGLLVNKDYLLSMNFSPSRTVICIVLKENATLMDNFESAFIAEVAAYRCEQYKNPDEADMVRCLQEAIATKNSMFAQFIKEAEVKGWNLSYSLLGFDEWRLQ